jgi:hypothetical protein
VKFLASVALLASLTAASAVVPPQIHAFVEQWCVDCHDADSHKGGLNLDGLDFTAQPEAHANWVRVFDRVLSGEMPPPKKPRADEGAKRAFLTTLGGGLVQQHTAMKGTVMRRLNRVEYENTLRDLLGVRTELAELLPEDGKAHGFDNVGEALDLSAVQLQRYMDAARRAIDDAVRKIPQPVKETKTFTLDQGRGASLVGKQWHKTADGAVVVFNNGGFPSPQFDAFRAPVEGTYRLRFTAYGYQIAEPVFFQVYQGTFGRDADSELVGIFSVPPDKATTLEATAYLRRGRTLRILPQGMPNPFQGIKEHGPAGYKGPGLAIQGVEIEGPIFSEWPGRGHRLLFGDLPVQMNAADGKRKFPRTQSQGEIVSENSTADADRLLNGFVPAAFRRPVSAEKIAPYLQLALDELKAGSDFESAMRTAYIAVLCAPDFLYLREPAGRLDEYALASRLSYFAWSSAPDAELLAAAGRRELSQPAKLRAQTERLLNDPRAERFTRNFTGQWLNLREIDFTAPDKQLYPEFDDVLKDSMVRETELFFEEVLKRNLSALNFVDSDWTILNERLATHYRIPGVTGTEFRKVSLRPEQRRGGVLTHGSVLKVSANGTNTSPVVRGIYVMERILGLHPSPPPPGTPGVEPDIRGAQTLRQQLDKHRNLETCNGCHRVIDPPGFALEHYDAAGGWRENYRSLGKDFPKPPPELTGGVNNVQWRIGPAVDASGTTPDGKPFKDLTEYKKILLAQPARFTRALAEKLAVYGTGRGMGFSDRTELDRIATSVAGKDKGFRDLVHEIVQSGIFRSK